MVHAAAQTSSAWVLNFGSSALGSAHFIIHSFMDPCTNRIRLGWTRCPDQARGYEDTAAASGAHGCVDMVEAVVESGHRPWSTDGAATSGA